MKKDFSELAKPQELIISLEALAGGEDKVRKLIDALAIGDAGALKQYFITLSGNRSFPEIPMMNDVARQGKEIIITSRTLVDDPELLENHRQILIRVLNMGLAGEGGANKITDIHFGNAKSLYDHMEANAITDDNPAYYAPLVMSDDPPLLRLAKNRGSSTIAVKTDENKDDPEIQGADQQITIVGGTLFYLADAVRPRVTAEDLKEPTL